MEMTYKQAAQILRDAKELINTPEKLARKVFASDKNGVAVPPAMWGEGKPDCLCSVGAVAYATGAIPLLMEHTLPITLLAQALNRDGFYTWGTCQIERVGNFSDEHTHEEVIAMFDRAIALAEEFGEDDE